MRATFLQRNNAIKQRYKRHLSPMAFAYAGLKFCIRIQSVRNVTVRLYVIINKTKFCIAKMSGFEIF